MRAEVMVPTGIEGLDEIVRGGLPAGHVYLVQGSPGTGKTTLALQFLRAGIASGERVLYVALGETHSELATVARSHDWTLDGIDVCDLHPSEHVRSDSQYTFYHPSEIELGETTRRIMAAAERVRPRRVVLDSLSEMRLLAHDSLLHRRQILGLKARLTALDATVLLLDTTSHPAREFQLQTVAHGVLTLEQRDPEYGAKRRRLTFEKLRGVPFRDGWHDFVIATGGLRVFPRLRAGGLPERRSAALASSGDAQLDALLCGGVERGSSALLVGPSGVGKSTVATRFVRAALDRGERAAVYLFDESTAAWLRRARSLGLGVHEADAARLELCAFHPSELSPGAFAHRVRRHVEDEALRLVVIDSINGFGASMPEERSWSLHVHELLSFLAHRDVTTLLLLATSAPSAGVGAPLELGYIADTILSLRYFEAFGEVRKAISAPKKRLSAHETTLRELEIRSGAGVRIGEKLHEIRGVLTSTLEYTGKRQDLLGDDAKPRT